MGAVKVLKFQALYSIYYGLNFAFFASTQLFLKPLTGMTNSVDPDQTALSTPFAHGINFCQKLQVRNFRTFTVLIRLTSVRGL